MNEIPQKRKPGRPRMDPSELRGPNITFRTPGGLRTRLEQSAQAAGRALSEEVVSRLERSFDHEFLDRIERVTSALEKRAL